jgi:hypothetical protein
MMRTPTLLLGVALAASSAFAQATPPAQAGATASTQAASSTAAQANSDAAQLASGTKFEAALDQSLDANKNKVGDKVTAHTVDAVKSGDKVVLPKNTKLVGHVSEVKAKSKDDANSTLGIVFDRAELKGGQQMPVHLGIQAIAAAQNATAAGADDAMAMGAGSAMGGASAGGGGAMRGGGGSGGGLVGGVGSTAGGAVGSTVNAAGSSTGAVANTAGSAAGSTRGVAGGAANSVNAVSPHAQLSSSSQGVFGMQGLALNSQAANQTQGSVVTGTGRNVHLDSGTRLMMNSAAGPSQ